tara:strand:+ start:245 stop:433 length:189 start_codon:yes stop_codon:yes gene_type:complete
MSIKADMHEWFLDNALNDMEENGGMLESDYEPDCPEEYPSDLSDEYMTLLNKYFSIMNRKST